MPLLIRTLYNACITSPLLIRTLYHPYIVMPLLIRTLYNACITSPLLIRTLYHPYIVMPLLIRTLYNACITSPLLIRTLYHPYINPLIRSFDPPLRLHLRESLMSRLGFKRWADETCVAPAMLAAAARKPGDASMPYPKLQSRAEGLWVCPLD